MARPVGNPNWLKGRVPPPEHCFERNKRMKEVAALARVHTPEAIATLVLALANRTKDSLVDAVAVRAAEILLDRGYGKAKETVEVVETSDEERRLKIESIMREARERLVLAKSG